MRTVHSFGMKLVKIPLKTSRLCLEMHQRFWLQIFINHLNLLLMLVMLVQGGGLLQEDENGVDHPVCYLFT